MPIYKKLVGNYCQVLEKANMPLAFAQHSEDGLQTIQTDLPRECLFNFRKHLTQHLDAWNSRDAQHCYSQGDMSANIFSTIFMLYLNRSNADVAFYSSTNKGSLFFAYFDDNNTPCGFSLTYSKLDPSLWSCAIIHNTIGRPEERDVTVFCREDMVENDAPTIQEKKVLVDILSQIKSKEIEQLLSTLFIRGKLNEPLIDSLNSHIRPINYNQSCELCELLRSKLIEGEDDDVCLWLILLIKDTDGSLALNKFTFDDLQMLRDNPRQSEWLAPFKDKHASPGQLENIKKWARESQPIPKPYEHFITSLAATSEENTKTSQLFTRRNLLIAVGIFAVVGAAVASIFFPLLPVILALVISASPIGYFLNKTNAEIGLKSRETEERFAQAENQVSIQDGMMQTIMTHVKTLYNEVYPKTEIASPNTTPEATIEEESNLSQDYSNTAANKSFV